MGNVTLTIVVPTYNRADRLLRQLRSLCIQGMYDKYHLVILDNHSNYDVKTFLNGSGLDERFLNNIILVTRPINTKMGFNISSTFLYCHTRWLYVISDDDICTNNSLRTLFEYIELYPCASLIKFSNEYNKKFNDRIFSTAEEYVKLYKEGLFASGDIFYIGNNLYNIERLSSYLSDSFEFSSQLIGHMMPVLHSLIDSKAEIVLSDKHVQYFVDNRSGDSWHSLSSLLKFAQLYDNYWGDLDKSHMLMKIIYPHFSFLGILIQLLREHDIKYRRYVYKRIRHTILEDRMSMKRYFLLILYKVEDIAKIPILSKLVAKYSI